MGRSPYFSYHLININRIINVFGLVFAIVRRSVSEQVYLRAVFDSNQSFGFSLLRFSSFFSFNLDLLIDEYKKYLKDSITETYKKDQNGLLDEINREAAAISKHLGLE